MASIKNRLHGQRLYWIWSNMRQRCYREKDIGYKDYGGRGIRVCDEWNNSFDNFYNWAICNGYEYKGERKTHIDRIDNNGNYEPSNCRWVDQIYNARNKRTNIYFEHNGETKCLKEWCLMYGMKYKVVHQRIFRDGMSFESIISNPLKTYERDRCKLNEQQVLEIAKSKESLTITARRYNMSVGAIQSIRNGSNWSKITGIKNDKIRKTKIAV